DVAGQYPEVMTKLRSAYDAWWEDISPAFEKTSRIHVGNPDENPAVLTCHDWITGGNYPPWNQRYVRTTRPVEIYHWAIAVEQPGTYRIALRRWPREAGLSLRSGAEPGDPVPGLEANRETEGVALPITGARIEIAGKTQAMDIPQDMLEAVFEIELPAGAADLKAHFKLDSGEEVGAYYAYVEKL
ncbi:MAG TPA: hypothetical protein VJ904_03970, partial [Tichowtungia sp.]|nr:hypothetical protein [Tichowtungia sp.]